MDDKIGNRKVQPSIWTCIDGLGRVMSTCEQVGEKRKDRTVAIFYFPCHGFWPEIRYARNVMERLSKTDENTIAEAKNDYNHPLWATPNPEEDSWYWDEPIFGYYDTHDEYVLRKHAEMLADAGVDLIAFDCCVGLQTTSSYHTVFKVFEEALQDGVNSPKVTFVLPMGNPERCRSYMLKLYDEIYSKGKTDSAGRCHSMNRWGIRRRTSLLEFFTGPARDTGVNCAYRKI